MPADVVPRLWRIDRRPEPQGPHEKLVLIHGMASSCASAFGALAPNLAALDQPRRFDLWAFDYDTDQPFATSADQLVAAMQERPFGATPAHLVGHSMGGLVARMAVLRHNLPRVRRIVTLATPNHGTLNGIQLNLLGQLIALASRNIRPLYIRKQGVLDLMTAHDVMKAALAQMEAEDPGRLDGKSYVSIPAQYYHSKRQLGDPSPSMTMGSATLSIAVLNKVLRQRLVTLRPVHDGIVEERSNRLSPSPPGSSSEASYMPTRNDAAERLLHVSHEAGDDHDHVTITSCEEIADLIRAVLIAPQLDEQGVCDAVTRYPGRLRVRPPVS